MGKAVRRLWRVLVIGAALAVLAPAVALAYSWYIDFTITESAGTAYTSLPLSGLSNNAYYAANGYISATGLNTRVYNSDNTALPHMLSENYTWFVTAQPANNSQVVRYALGESALTSFDIIPGYSGNITTADNTTLELDRHFDISVSGYINTSAPSGDKNILYKDGAAQLDVSAASTITFHALNADNSDNWTMSAAGVASGSHTIRVYANGTTAYLYVDAGEVDTEALYQTSFTTLGAIGGNGSNEAANQMGFYAEGLYWVFYHTVADVENIAYKTSADGSSWSGETVVSSASTSGLGKFSVTFDGTYMHYSRLDSVANPDVLYYRRGDPEADGSITWSDAEQTVGSNNELNKCAIAVSQPDHYPFITSTLAGGTYPNAAVWKSSTTNGTWTTAGGYPVTFTRWASGGSTAPAIAAYPTDNKMIYAWSYATGTNPYQVRARYYNGSSWAGSDETVTTVGGYIGTATTDDSGNAYVSWYASISGTNTIQMNKRSSGGSWGTSVNVYSPSTCTSGLTYDPVANQLFILYSHNSAAGQYFKIYDIASATLSSEYTLGAGTFGYASHVFPRALDDKIVSLGMYSTSVNFASVIFPWEWPDNSNDWAWMANNSMSYADNITLDVLGTRRLTYKPDSIIVGTTLPDESGNGQDGTFNWGTNPAGVTVTSGPLATGVTPSTPTAAAPPWVLVPTTETTEPAGLFTEGGECMLGITELADASEATGNPRALFPIAFAFLLALLAGFGVYGATHNTRMGQRGSVFLQSITSLAVLVFFYVGGCGVIPGWVLIPFGLESMFFLVGRNPQHSST